MRINRINLAAAMAREDLNVKLLSEKSGVSRATISGIKSGKSCSKDTADKLILVLGNDILEDRKIS
jgi:putative transcriptional regulator